jgi:hypothetical protein
MKNTQYKNTVCSDCATLINQSAEDSLMEILLKKNSMTKKEIKLKIQELHTKHLNSMNKYEMWDITREILYLKIALGQLKKCRNQNWNQLKGLGMQHDGGFLFKSGTVYPFWVDLKIEEDSIEVLIEEFIAELTPYLNEAEQMLFKVALLEEIFDPDEEDET